MHPIAPAAERTTRLAGTRAWIDWQAPADAPVRIAELGVGRSSFAGGGEGEERCVALVGIETLGGGKVGTAGKRHVDGVAGQRLRYRSHRQSASGDVHRLEIEQADDEAGLSVRSIIEHRDGIDAFRFRHELTLDAAAKQPTPLAYISSFALAGLPWTSDARLWTAANPWSAEHRWRAAPLSGYGLHDSGMHRYGQRGTKNRIAIGSAGAWSSSEYLPMGALEYGEGERVLLWEVEHNGAWQFEIGDRVGGLYLSVAGPSDPEHQWHHYLGPGETFATVPVTVVLSDTGIEGAAAQATAHRRALRRPHQDHETLPVVFNDFMNCLMADPDTEKLLPLVEAAAAAGAEVFCIDAGWFDDDPGSEPGPGGVPGWWDSIGAWRESAKRFPGERGLAEVIDRIRDLGMVPGLWLEPECVGVHSPTADALPSAAFFHRDWRRVSEWGRHQLDFGNASARAFVDERIDELIARYGLGYLKFDYNIDAGIGTDLNSDSAGDGLLSHNRAYLVWLEKLLERHPGLTIENCAAGGSRTDQALLSRLPIQSLTDQQDHRLMPPIAAAAPLAVPPEQGAVWAYPQPEFTDAENTFTLASALLGRVHLSGRIDLLDPARAALVKRAMDVYKSYRHVLPTAIPRWPLGLPAWDDGLVCLALEAADGDW
ncbi:alpha-galactosidase [Actinospica sp. MGRD01-02]|uniref:Alpha-galactosidase n=1 Tax=Actinospica acidithermotolerans TaxID=2828514 RepID=A0A941EEA0_9ACTN|nr:glycoside hydrolase family 36 protein [Actinospica acidithermotolerans]MBR7828865.1 alpha-galactosidase [Actinospica acidithermotolerans]